MARLLHVPLMAGGLCLPCTTTQDQPCPNKLRVGIFNGASQKFQVTFLGTTLGAVVCPDPWTACGTPNAYMALDPPFAYAVIDIWAAYRDGLWRSSIDLTIAYNHAPVSGCIWGSFPQTSVGALWDRVGASPVEKVFNSTALPGTACATTLVATVTVFDDGTFVVT